MKPILKQIKNFPDFFASDDGNIYRIQRLRYGHIIKFYLRKLPNNLSKSGYVICCLTNPITKNRMVQTKGRWILGTFCPEHKEEDSAIYINGNTLDSSLFNLKWGKAHLGNPHTKKSTYYKKPIYVFYDNGKVEIFPSRELIPLSKQTITNLLRKNREGYINNYSRKLEATFYRESDVKRDKYIKDYAAKHGEIIYSIDQKINN